MLTRILSWLFGAPEEINGAERCPTYLYRWHLLTTRWGKLYLHRFVGEDWSRDLHDHPKRFVTLMLWGSYVETTLDQDGKHRDRTYRAPFLRSFPPEHLHRVRLGESPECWTLVFVGRGSRPWGFFNPEHGWIAWRSYVTGSYAWVADQRAVCQSIGGE